MILRSHLSSKTPIRRAGLVSSIHVTTAIKQASTLMAPHGVTNTTEKELKPFNDWPNDIGFETFQEQTSPVELKVSGKIPVYAAGVLYRTGPGGYQVETDSKDTFAASHWFDGFSQTHRFVLASPEGGDHVTNVTYNSRHTCNGLIEDIRKKGDLGKVTFGQKQDPCESFFKKVMSSFQAVAAGQANAVDVVNVGVTVKPNMPMPGHPSSQLGPKDENGISNLWVKTDVATLQSINPTTLEPNDVARHPKLHPSLKGPFTAAHSRTDPLTGDWYNYNLDVGRISTYRVFRVSSSTGKTDILATISGGNVRAAYLHSFMLTDRYVLLCIYGAYLGAGGAKVLWTKNMLDALEFHPDKKNVWLVIDRLGSKGLVGVYESEPHFAFHPVNAWDLPSETEPGKFDIFTDVPVYRNLDVLKRFYYDNMKSTSPSALTYTKSDSCRANITRFKLSSIGSSSVSVTSKAQPVEVVFEGASTDTPELPTFNPKFACKPSRYIYGVSDRGNSTFLDGILKFDSVTRTSKSWSVHAQSPGEPIFLPDPQGKDEDDGVLLSVVLDGTKGKSYLLCLDAKSFEERGRAEMESAFPFGFHGTHISKM